jgi:hypothetical protein
MMMDWLLVVVIGPCLMDLLTVICAHMTYNLHQLQLRPRRQILASLKSRSSPRLTLFVLARFCSKKEQTSFLSPLHHEGRC